MTTTIKAVLSFFLALSGLGLSTAQVPSGFVPVSGTRIYSNGTLASGVTLCAQPVTSAGLPIGVKVGGLGGHTVDQPICTAVTSGAFSLPLPDTSQTTPLNACFRVTAKTSNGMLVLSRGYECVQPTSAAGSTWCDPTNGCDFDLFPPNLTPLVVSQQGQKGDKGDQGAAGSTGAAGAAGTTTASGTSGGFVVPGALQYGNNYPCLQAFGDSITQGTGATTWMSAGQIGVPLTYPGRASVGAPAGTSPGGPTAYAYKLLAAFGNCGGVYGLGGDMAEDMTFKVRAFRTTKPSGNPAMTAMISTNNVTVCGSAANCQDTFVKALGFSIAWGAIPDTALQLASRAAKTGTWVADVTIPGALLSAGTGSLNYTLFNTGSTVYVFYKKFSGGSGTGTVSVNGSTSFGDSSLSFFGLNGQPITTPNEGAIGTLAVARFPGLTPGTQTVNISVPGAGTAEIVGVASSPSSTDTLPGAPAVFVGGTPLSESNSIEPTGAAYNTLIQSTVSTFAADGLPVRFVDVRATMNSTTDFDGGQVGNIVCPASWLNPLHPGDCGHEHIYQAFRGAMLPVIQPAQSVALYAGPSGHVDTTSSQPGTNGADSVGAKTVFAVLADGTVSGSIGGGAFIGIGTRTPDAIGSLINLPGSHLKVAYSGAANSGAARIIVEAAGGGGNNAELHLGNLAAPAGSRQWEQVIDSNGNYTLAQCSDDFTVCVPLLSGSPTTGLGSLGLGTADPSTFSGTTGAAGRNLQVKYSGAANTGAARILAIADGGGGNQPEVHLINLAAPSGYHNWKSTVTSEGVFQVALCNDAFTSCRIPQSIDPSSGASSFLGVTIPSLATGGAPHPVCADTAGVLAPC